MGINLSYEKYSKWATGRKTVTSAGTAETLVASTTRGARIIIQAETDNTNNVAVGDVNVVAAAGSERGTILSPGSTIDVLLIDLVDIFVDSVTNGEGVTFTYYTQG